MTKKDRDALRAQKDSLMALGTKLALNGNAQDLKEYIEKNDWVVKKKAPISKTAKKKKPPKKTKDIKKKVWVGGSRVYSLKKRVENPDLNTDTGPDDIDS